MTDHHGQAVAFGIYQNHQSKEAPILIGMVKVLDAIGETLELDGYEVLNNGVRVPFPSNGNQKQFHKLALEILT